MAIYVPAGLRRRRLIGLAIGMLVAGLALGFWVGRTTSPGVDDAVADVRSQAAEAATGLQRLPIEYEQAIASKGGESTRTITEAVTRARTTLDGAFADAPWFGPTGDDAAIRAVAAVDRAATGKVSAVEFGHAVDRAVSTIRSTFGLPGDTATPGRSGG